MTVHEDFAPEPAVHVPTLWEADRLHSLRSYGIDVSASVGVTYIEPDDNPSPDLVLSRADDRMYEAKRHRYASEYAADPGEMQSAEVPE